MDSAASSSDIKSIHKATAVLLFLASSHEGRTFTEIREALGIGKSTAHRFLATLENNGLVRRTRDDGRYYLGLVALRIGVAAGNQLELRKSIRPFLTELTQRTGETSNLVVLDGTKPVFIDNVESTNTLRIYSRVGRHTSPYATSAGKALLAYQSPTYVEEVLASEAFERRTERTIVSREVFLAELERVRRQGFAVDDEEGELGARCVGAPIINGPGIALAAISISGPSARVSQQRVPELARIVVEVAEHAQRALGIHPTQPAFPPMHAKGATPEQEY
ncbi:MAG: IclR family transcriptional regulator [Trueperaceae bacterium]